MELKDFGKFIKGKSLDKLLHRTRRESLNRILAYDDHYKATAEIIPYKKPEDYV